MDLIQYLPEKFKDEYLDTGQSQNNIVKAVETLQDFINGVVSSDYSFSGKITELESFWDPYATAKFEKLLKLLDSNNIVFCSTRINQLLGIEDNTTSQKAYLSTVQSLNKMKGTLRGVSNFLRLFGISVNVVPWYRNITMHTERCSVIVGVTLDDNTVTDEIYTIIEEMLTSLIDICITPLWVFFKSFVDFMDTEEELNITHFQSIEERYARCRIELQNKFGRQCYYEWNHGEEEYPFEGELRFLSSLELTRYDCVCDYIYDPLIGDVTNGVDIRTPFSEVSSTWICPLCNLPKTSFTEAEIDPSYGITALKFGAIILLNGVDFSILKTFSDTIDLTIFNDHLELKNFFQGMKDMSLTIAHIINPSVYNGEYSYNDHIYYQPEGGDAGIEDFDLHNSRGKTLKSILYLCKAIEQDKFESLKLPEFSLNINPVAVNKYFRGIIPSPYICYNEPNSLHRIYYSHPSDESECLPLYNGIYKYSITELTVPTTTFERLCYDQYIKDPILRYVHPISENRLDTDIVKNYDYSYISGERFDLSERLSFTCQKNYAAEDGSYAYPRYMGGDKPEIDGRLFYNIVFNEYDDNLNIVFDHVKSNGLDTTAITDLILLLDNLVSDPTFALLGEIIFLIWDPYYYDNLILKYTPLLSSSELEDFIKILDLFCYIRDIITYKKADIKSLTKTFKRTLFRDYSVIVNSLKDNLSSVLNSLPTKHTDLSLPVLSKRYLLERNSERVSDSIVEDYDKFGYLYDSQIDYDPAKNWTYSGGFYTAIFSKLRSQVLDGFSDTFPFTVVDLGFNYGIIEFLQEDIVTEEILESDLTNSLEEKHTILPILKAYYDDSAVYDGTLTYEHPGQRSYFDGRYSFNGEVDHDYNPEASEIIGYFSIYVEVSSVETLHFTNSLIVTEKARKILSDIIGNGGYSCLNILKVGADNTLAQAILDDPPYPTKDNTDLQYTQYTFERDRTSNFTVTYPTDDTVLFDIVIGESECNGNDIICAGIFSKHDTLTTQLLFASQSFPYIAKDNTKKLRIEYSFQF